MRSCSLLLLLVAACESSGGRAPNPDMAEPAGPDMADPPLIFDGGLPPASLCISDPMACYTVYASSDTALYKIDLQAKSLIKIGDFKTGGEDITDIAVAPDDKIYAISQDSLFTVDATDGHVTKVSALARCGNFAVALTFDNNGVLYAGDYAGALCKIDLTQTPPKVTQIGKLSNGLALAGDIVVVGDGTMYGTAVRLSDPSGMGTNNNNLLIEIDPANARTTTLGSTGGKSLFGVSFALGQVFGFSHDGTGQAFTINPTNGRGTRYNTFDDPSTNMPIRFSGAGVNSQVHPAPIM